MIFNLISSRPLKNCSTVINQFVNCDDEQFCKNIGYIQRKSVSVYVTGFWKNDPNRTLEVLR